MYRIGIDIGGTFTDLAAVDESGAVSIAKHPTTPADQSIGLLEGLSVLAAELELSRGELLAQTALIIHGTTVATNALLERKGARVGMLVTDGFRDVIEQREGLKPERYNVRLPPAPVLVPRALRLPVEERIRFDGSVETPLNEQSVRAGIDALKHAGVQAVAVCCAHSYANPANERRIGELLAEEMPGVHTSLSCVVLPQIKEFERFSTTVVNAFIAPVLSGYMKRLQDRLAQDGYEGEVLIMQSHGGLATIEDSVKLGAGCVLSGPAGGIAGACYAADITGVRDLITFDMGGTSSDIALIRDGEPCYSDDKTVAGTKVALPSIDIHSIGAGGGSVARVEIGGLLHVGPESAGSDPGPACYARNGERATTTDANVVLGYYDAANFLDGKISFDGAGARHVTEGIAAELDVEVIDAAAGIIRVINTQMAEGIRLVAVRAGADPRDFTLLSFGGAAGLHVTAIARMLNISRVIIPRSASVLSAWGMLATNLRYDYVRTAVNDVRSIDADLVRTLFLEMELEGRERIARSGNLIKRTDLVRSLDMRYGEQIFEISVPLKDIDLDAGDLIEQVIAAFHARHEELYSYSIPEQEVVLVNLRLSVVGVMNAMPAELPVTAAYELQPKSQRRVYLDEWADVPVYNLDVLGAGTRVSGPAVIESRTTTILLLADDHATVTGTGWLDIEVGQVAGSDARDSSHSGARLKVVGTAGG